MIVHEAAREIEVLDTVDVLVAGGGVSGCAAALAAARAGAKTMLLERNGTLGGVATTGLMANIGNLFMDRDGRIVIHGIAKEVVERMVARGAASSHWASREVPGIVIDSEQLKVVLIGMLREADVLVLTHTWAARPILEGDTVTGAFCETKIGRHAVLARVVVDATGEADVAAQTGCPMRWDSGSASLEFKMGRVDLEALYQHFRQHPETFPVGMDMVKGFAEFERNWVERGIFFFPHGGGRKWDILQRAIVAGELETARGVLWRMDAAGLYGLKGRDTVIVNSNFWRVDTLHPAAVSQAELEAHEACYYVADFFLRHVPGFEHAYVVQVATDLGIRTSRGIEGIKTLFEAAARAGERQPDVVGCAPVRASFDETGEFFASCSFDIPYGILLPQNVHGLLIGSGKSVSCQPQGLIRGMSTCMLLGQAAGTAAALAAFRGISPQQLQVDALQRELLRQGAYLGSQQRLQELGLA